MFRNVPQFFGLGWTIEEEAVEARPLSDFELEGTLGSGAVELGCSTGGLSSRDEDAEGSGACVGGALADESTLAIGVLEGF